MQAPFDLRGIIKTEPFSGRDADWSDWAFGFRSHAALLGLGELLSATESSAQPPDLNDMDEDARRGAKLLWHVLVQAKLGPLRKASVQRRASYGSGAAGV